MYHSMMLLVLPLATATSLRRAFDPSSIPEQCTSTCSPVTTAVNTCTAGPIACGICTTKTEQEAVQCVNCIISADATTDAVPAGQAYINQYVADCAALGVVLPPAQVSAPKTTSSTSTGSSQGGPNPPSGDKSNPLGGGGSGLVAGTPSLHVGPMLKVLMGVSVIGHLLIQAGMWM